MAVDVVQRILHTRSSVNLYRAAEMHLVILMSRDAFGVLLASSLLEMPVL